MAAKLGGARPSELAGIICPNAALDFDIACAYRLEIYDAEVRHEGMKALSKLTAYEVSKIFSSEEEAATETW